MKFSIFLGALALGSLANAQYFSEGWAPGQPTTEAPAQPTPTFTPQKEAAPKTPPSLSSLFDINTLLSSGPSVSLFARFGINITERLEGVLERAKIWDERVALITDDNYQELIVNEPLTDQEEKDRTWIIIISVSAGKQDGISKFMDDVFDTAFNDTQVAGDLTNVRWGRIDYFNVTAVTTKWAIWQAPYLVILRDRGQTLRFYKPHQLRLRDGAMRAFLENEDWKLTPPWATAYAPGGDREFLMDFLALWMTRIYNTVIMIPRWLLFVMTGSFASVAINFLHRGSAKEPSPNREQPTAPLTTNVTATSVEHPAPNAASPTKRKRAKAKK